MPDCSGDQIGGGTNASERVEGVLTREIKSSNLALTPLECVNYALFGFALASYISFIFILLHQFRGSFLGSFGFVPKIVLYFQ